MRAIVTGARGTVGRVLVERLRAAGHWVIGWDREAVSPGDAEQVRDFVHDVQPQVIFHLAIASQPSGLTNEGEIINESWPRQLAELAAEDGFRLVVTSTVMVFTDDAKGPFTVASEPDANEGYGLAKLKTERIVRAAHPDAVIARLGWQIGTEPGGNNMLSAFEDQQVKNGFVSASTKWLPACSFITDTCDALIRLSQAEAGLYLIDSNEKWNYFEIASALSRLHGDRWKIVPNEDFVYDQRMIDSRVGMPTLARRLNVE